MSRATTVIITVMLALAAVPMAVPTASADHICQNMSPACDDPEETIVQKTVCRFVYWPWYCRL